MPNFLEKFVKFSWKIVRCSSKDWQVFLQKSLNFLAKIVKFFWKIVKIFYANCRVFSQKVLNFLPKMLNFSVQIVKFFCKTLSTLNRKIVRIFLQKSLKFSCKNRHIIFRVFRTNSNLSEVMLYPCGSRFIFTKFDWILLSL